MFHKSRMIQSINKAHGNVLVIVLFVVVVMGYLSASLLRTTWSNHSATTREFVGTQAWFLAQSASEWALTQFYPLDLNSGGVATHCGSLATAFPGVDIGSCSVGVTCSDIGTLPASVTGVSDVSLYRVSAVAQCGNGLSRVERRQEIWVKE